MHRLSVNVNVVYLSCQSKKIFIAEIVRFFWNFTSTFHEVPHVERDLKGTLKNCKRFIDKDVLGVKAKANETCTRLRHLIFKQCQRKKPTFVEGWKVRYFSEVFDVLVPYGFLGNLLENFFPSCAMTFWMFVWIESDGKVVRWVKNEFLKKFCNGFWRK